MLTQDILVKPISGALGAMIEGVDLGRELDNRTSELIHQALLDHCVIFFRNQTMTPEQHIALGRRFGTLNVHDYVKAMDGHPEIIVVAKAEGDTKNFGGGWHSDVTYLDEPALGSILYCLEAPSHGGDTMFANQYLAYDALSPGMKRMLDGMRALHTAGHVYGPRGRATIDYVNQLKAMTVFGSAGAEKEVEHPVVRTHPETGRKCLYISKGFTTRFKDMTVDESLPLLEYLWAHCSRPEFTCRFRWQPGSVAFWDNRSVQHYALNDYHGQRRIMHRVTCQRRPARLILPEEPLERARSQ